MWAFRLPTCWMPRALSHICVSKLMLANSCWQKRAGHARKKNPRAVTVCGLNEPAYAPRTQLLGCVPLEAAYVGASHCQAPHVAVKQALHRPAQVLPGGRVVAGPVRCKATRAWEGGPARAQHPHRAARHYGTCWLPQGSGETGVAAGCGSPCTSSQHMLALLSSNSCQPPEACWLCGVMLWLPRAL